MDADRAGTSFGSAGAEPHGYSDPTPTHEIVAETFAKDLARCIEKGRIDHDFEELILVAAPRFLGQLRQSLSDPSITLVTRSISLNFGSMSDEQVALELESILELNPHSRAREPRTPKVSDIPSLNIQINTGRGIHGGESMEREIERVLEKRLKHFGRRITRIEVNLSDLNGPKGGPMDKRCILVGWLAGINPLSGSCDAPTVMQAVQGATDKLERSFENRVGKLDRHAS